jgi:hypothetical protein
MACRFSYIVKTYDLLPPTHLGGRRGVSTDLAIQILLDRIHRAWGVGLPVVSVPLLDMIRIYNDTTHERLLHDLRRKGLGKVIPCVRAFLSDQSTRIRMPEGLAERVPTPAGILQESPLSPILYRFYNVGLIEACTEQETRESVKAENLKRMVAYGWVDGVSCLAAGMSEEETVAKLQVAYYRAQG